MSQHYQKESFKKLLEKLQEESWQLELIISGFAIYGLFQALEPLQLSMQESQNEQQVYTFIIALVALVSCAILIFNLLLHVILRGLWIGALGLRYVSGDIEYDKLKYSRKFTNYLSRKVGSFDKYISNLENYCSVIFAISFLLIFYVLAFTLTMVAIALIGNYVIGNDNLPVWLSQYVGITVMIFIIIGMMLTVFDFVTQGWLKKKQWISRLYFPVYWVFSFLTLSFLYRPLVYNFLDNKFGKRLSFILLPLYAVILVLTSLRYNTSNYLDPSQSSNTIYSNNRNYEDMIEDEDGVFIRNVAIPSKVINTNYLKIFVVFSQNLESQIFSFNEALRPEKDRRGLSTDIRFTDDGISFAERDSINKSYLESFNGMVQLKIDTLVFDSDFIMSQSKKAELGFETYLNLNTIPEGKHLLRVNRRRIQENDTTLRNLATIPFWHYKGFKTEAGD